MRKVYVNEKSAKVCASRHKSPIYGSLYWAHPIFFYNGLRNKEQSYVKLSLCPV